ncbi:MAG: hypothetical protein U0271_31090 [Polyangiaceae bacterium]
MSLRPAHIKLEASAMRRWIGPLLLITATPPLAFLLWLTVRYYHGSFLELLRNASFANLSSQFPRPSWVALGMILGWVGGQGVLLKVLPGKPHYGPVTPTGQQPLYKLNGIAAWIITHLGLYVAAYPLHLFSPSAVYDRFGEILVTINALALAFCAFLYVKGRVRPSTTDAVYTGEPLFDFFQGIELHPTLFGVNLKQLINCRVSMMGWSVIVLAFAAKQHALYGHVSTSMMVCAGLIAAYLFKFFWWEGGYFNSLDIMHDRFGYYICWGVLVWVPAVYTIPALYLAEHPLALSPALAGAVFVLGLFALWANYAADDQRQRVRRTKGETTIWGRPPALILAQYRTTDGEQRENLLLASGFWGLARHFHYVPEISLALLWSLPAMFDNLLPYFYVIFLTFLLLDRANRDDKRCRTKYGTAWEEYCKRVPYKVVPGIY